MLDQSRRSGAHRSQRLHAGFCAQCKSVLGTQWLASLLVYVMHAVVCVLRNSLSFLSRLTRVLLANRPAFSRLLCHVQVLTGCAFPSKPGTRSIWKTRRRTCSKIRCGNQWRSATSRLARGPTEERSGGAELVASCTIRLATCSGSGPCSTAWRTNCIIDWRADSYAASGVAGGCASNFVRKKVGSTKDTLI